MTALASTKICAKLFRTGSSGSAGERALVQWTSKKLIIAIRLLTLAILSVLYVKNTFEITIRSNTFSIWRCVLDLNVLYNLKCAVSWVCCVRMCVCVCALLTEMEKFSTENRKVRQHREQQIVELIQSYLLLTVFFSSFFSIRQRKRNEQNRIEQNRTKLKVHQNRWWFEFECASNSILLYSFTLKKKNLHTNCKFWHLSSNRFVCITNWQFMLK